MFTKKSFVEEIANSMERQLVDGVINKQAEQQAKIVKAADYLNAAAEIFDESGMIAQAEVITSVLESLAAKNKAKDKKKNSKKPAKKAPSSEKMVSNLKQKGWVFDESDAHDSNCADDNCASCGDVSYASDAGKSDECWWAFVSDEGEPYASFLASKEEAMDRFIETGKTHHGAKLLGPFDDVSAVYAAMGTPFRDDSSEDVLMADDHEELYSMLDNFKLNSDNEDEFDDSSALESHDMDFEDELDFGNFEDREGMHDPFDDFENSIDALPKHLMFKNKKW